MSDAVFRRAARVLVAFIMCAVLAFLPACSPAANDDGQGSASISGDVSTMLDITDSTEKQAVEAAMLKVRELGREPRIVATSPAILDICDKLEIPLVGICSSSLSKTPERYRDVPTVGTAMSPDMEKLGSLAPDWILSPGSLESDLKPKYEALGVDYAFCNLSSVQGMYRSIQELGEMFGCRDAAAELVGEFTSFYSAYQAANVKKTRPRVLVLMGLPGSYVIATKRSYVGSLVELAGGENVYDDDDQEFLTVNTEDMKAKEPDIIVRAAHALPDQVQAMFADDFTTNDIWKHFTAVQQGRVYDLPYESFGMSATFKYQDALAYLQQLFYGGGADAVEEGREEGSDG